jgi:hypothetical protein
LASVLSSLRYLLADVIGDDDEPTPSLPENLPAGAAPVVSEAIARLVDYQGPSYAQLYVDRLKRFVGRPGVDDAMLSDIARLMAMRMAYEDPIRIAQLTIPEQAFDAPLAPIKAGGDRRRFRIDELIGALPAVAAEPVLDVLEWVGWTHAPVSIKYSAGGCFRYVMARSGSGSNAGCT